MKTAKYIIFPAHSLSAKYAPFSVSAKSQSMLIQMQGVKTAKIDHTDSGMRIIDSIHEDGAKLVEMTPEAYIQFRTVEPGLKILPLIWYSPTLIQQKIEVQVQTTKAAVKISVSVQSENGKPVDGAEVVAFTDYENKTGDSATTNKKGLASLNLGGAKKKVEVLMIYPKHSHWGLCKKDFFLTNNATFEVKDIDLKYEDGLMYFGKSNGNRGTGVNVAIIDTGVGPNSDVVVTGGENTTGEDEKAYDDNGMFHGTHVAGIIACKKRGVAPNCNIYSYRVFRKGDEQASNYAISKAIDRAVQHGCQLINMSLGGGDPDEATKAAIEDARAKGSLVIVAAGNDGGKVSFPASYQMAVAVSALGRKGTFPSDSVEIMDVAAPYGSDKKNFFAAFSNRGSEVDLIGPGVDIISTVPGDRYATMSGTSMACPAVTGLAACLLSDNAAILAMPADQGRSDAIAEMLYKSAVDLGFQLQYQGHGLPTLP
jgi:subtilisin